MSSDTIISILLGIPLSIVTGLYSGVILSRYSRFAELRNEVLRVIRTIDFMQESDKVIITNDSDVPKLTLVVSDLFFLKHRKAAEIVTALISDIHEMKMHAQAGRLKVDAYSQNYVSWQQTGNRLPANKLVLFSPWAKL
jgi:hypothetical protein